MSCKQKNTNKHMANQKIHKYNSVINFELNKKLTFPDFTIKHTKLDKIQGPNNAKWQRQIFFFTVVTEDSSLEITWTTGRIQNTKFKVNQTEYELIMGSYSDSKDKSFKNLDLNQLMIIKTEQLKWSKQKIKTGDIVFRSTKKENGEVLFNEYGTIEKTLLGLFVWDLRNTMKQPLLSWSSKGIDKKITVFRKTSTDFQMNEMKLKDGSFNYLFDTASLELVSKNF